MICSPNLYMSGIWDLRVSLHIVKRAMSHILLSSNSQTLRWKNIAHIWSPRSVHICTYVMDRSESEVEKRGHRLLISWSAGNTWDLCVGDQTPKHVCKGIFSEWRLQALPEKKWRASCALDLLLRSDLNFCREALAIMTMWVWRRWRRQRARARQVRKPFRCWTGNRKYIINIRDPGRKIALNCLLCRQTGATLCVYVLLPFSFIFFFNPSKHATRIWRWKRNRVS